MQYILSQEEMDALGQRVDPAVHIHAVNEAVQAGNLLKEEIGCLKNQNNYCDDCPLSNLHIACQDSRDYSQ